MSVIEVLREAGPFAYLAVFIGSLGLLAGAVSLLLLLTGNRAAMALGVAALVCAAGAGGAGLVGTTMGKRQVEQALAMVGSGVDMERIRRVGFKEAQSASLVGFAMALLPGLLGALGALGASRLRRAPAAVQGVLEVQADDSGGRTTMAGVFVVIAALATGGAFVTWRAPIPLGRYPFADEDTDSWVLAGALERVVSRGPAGCPPLDEALRPFWKAAPKSEGDRDDWPRKFLREPDPSLDWKVKADHCARLLADATGADEVMSREELLGSPLLRDEALRNELLARELSAQSGRPATADDAVKALAGDPKAPPDTGGLGLRRGSTQPTGRIDDLGDRRDKGPATGTLDRAIIAKVIRSGQGATRRCYEVALRKDPTLEGKLVVELIISQTGQVRSTRELSKPPFASAEVRDCVLAAFKRLMFPQPEGGEVIVSYPVIFKAQ